MSIEWILIANASEARLLQQEPRRPLHQLQAFHHPASRLHSSELGDDARGREGKDGRSGAAAFEPRVSPQRREHLHFAQELARWVEDGARQGRCRSLQLYAASPFLGELKAALGPASQAVLAGAHDLDLSAAPLAEVEQRLRASARGR